MKRLALLTLLLARMSGAQCVVPITVANSPYAASASADQKINCDATGGSVTITLPVAGAGGGQAPNGRTINIKKEDTSFNCCIIAASGGQNIDDVATKSVCVFDHDMSVYSDGTAGWHQGPSYILPNLPFITLSDSSSQSLASTATGQVVTFNTEESKQYFTHSTISNTGRVTVDVPGTYLITISAILNSSTNGRTGWIWLRVNGADVPRSNTQQKINQAGTGGVIMVPFIATLARNDYFEIWWGGDNTTLFLQAVAQVPTPTPNARPAVPSIILSANLISRSAD